MTSFEQQVLDAIPAHTAVTVTWLWFELGVSPVAIQHALHGLDDQGQVTLRNGYYKLTEVAKNERGMGTVDQSHGQ